MLFDAWHPGANFNWGGGKWGRFFFFSQVATSEASICSQVVLFLGQSFSYSWEVRQRGKFQSDFLVCFHLRPVRTFRIRALTTFYWPLLAVIPHHFNGIVTNFGRWKWSNSFILVWRGQTLELGRLQTLQTYHRQCVRHHTTEWHRPSLLSQCSHCISFTFVTVSWIKLRCHAWSILGAAIFPQLQSACTGEWSCLGRNSSRLWCTSHGEVVQWNTQVNVHLVAMSICVMGHRECTSAQTCSCLGITVNGVTGLVDSNSTDVVRHSAAASKSSNTCSTRPNFCLCKEKWASENVAPRVPPPIYFLSPAVWKLTKKLTQLAQRSQHPATPSQPNGCCQVDARPCPAKIHRFSSETIGTVT